MAPCPHGGATPISAPNAAFPGRIRQGSRRSRGDLQAVGFGPSGSARRRPAGGASSGKLAACECAAVPTGDACAAGPRACPNASQRGTRRPAARVVRHQNDFSSVANPRVHSRRSQIQARLFPAARRHASTRHAFMERYSARLRPADQNNSETPR